MKTHNPMLPLVVAIGLALSAGIASAAAGETAMDARREAQIWTSYALNPHLRALDIKVEVDSTRAVLSGTVREGVEKDLAETIALGVSGIQSVDNRLIVDNDYSPPSRSAPEGESEFATVVEDATITATVKSKLLWNEHTDGLEIDVDTRNGTVTLSGSADTPAAKDLAGRLARNTDGVVAIDNQLTMDTNQTSAKVGDHVEQVATGVTDSWITARVKSSLMFSRWVEARDITVETTKGVVKLSGDVDSGAEKDLAIDLAKNIRGVKSVDATELKIG